METSSSVLNFWFKEITNEQKWKKDEKFDAQVRERFEPTFYRALRGELFSWRSSPEGRLAEIIVLDQFSRNMFRNKKEAFSGDALALVLAQEAVSLSCHTELEEGRRTFMLMPYMHSESKLVHIEAEKLFKEYAPSSYDFEIKHKVIIDRFGRYPHRNETLGRESSSEEISFLKQPNSSF